MVWTTINIKYAIPGSWNSVTILVVSLNWLYPLQPSSTLDINIDRVILHQFSHCWNYPSWFSPKSPCIITKISFLRPMCCPDAIGVWNTDVAIHPRATAILTYCSTHFFSEEHIFSESVSNINQLIHIYVITWFQYLWVISKSTYKQEMVLVGTEQDFMLFIEDYVETLI